MATASTHPRLNFRADDLFFPARAADHADFIGRGAASGSASPVRPARLSSGRVQRVTLWSTLFLFTVQQGRHLLAQTFAWQSFAVWVQRHMPSFS